MGTEVKLADSCAHWKSDVLPHMPVIVVLAFLMRHMYIDKAQRTRDLDKICLTCFCFLKVFKNKTEQKHHDGFGEETFPLPISTPFFATFPILFSDFYFTLDSLLFLVEKKKKTT